MTGTMYPESWQAGIEPFREAGSGRCPRMTKGSVSFVSRHYLVARRDPSCVGMTKGRGIIIVGRLFARSIGCFPGLSLGQAVPLQ
jgi:hypothetical protein